MQYILTVCTLFHTTSPPVGMVPATSMAMGQRMPMMANGMPQMVGPAGYMGKLQKTKPYNAFVLHFLKLNMII